jgi:hypothetical protein
MSQVRTSSLYTRTLFSGIALGVLAVLIALSSNWVMQGIGVNALNSGNPVAAFLAQLYGFLALACLPFSAALISAALVMRYLDQRLADRGE